MFKWIKSLFEGPLLDTCINYEPHHDYIIYDKVMMPSEYDMLAPGQAYISDCWTYRRKLVITYKCSKCGKIFIHTETNG